MVFATMAIASSKSVSLCVSSVLLLLHNVHVAQGGGGQVSRDCPDVCTCIDTHVTCDSAYGKRPLYAIPDGLPNDTLGLFLEYNEIGFVGTQLRPLESLETLDLSSNKVSDIDKAAFGTLRALVSLVLGRNKLHINDVSWPVLEAQENLVFLDLSSNYLGPHLPESQFLHQKRLQTLLLEGNRFETISDNAFHGLSDLETLILRDNSLQSVPTEALRHLDELEELDLSNNNFTVVGSHAFQGLTKLRILHLMVEERLVRIKNFAFSDAVELEVINIEKSRMLSSIERNAFHGLVRLKHVNLQENALRALQQDLVSWKRLNRLFLFDNPWHCDCHLSWMAVMLSEASSQGTSVPRVGDVTCESPDRLAGRVIAFISKEDFQCYGGEENVPSIGLSKIIVIVAVACFVTFALTLLGMKLSQRLRKRDVLSTRIAYGWLGGDGQPDQTYGSVKANSIVEYRQ